MTTLVTVIYRISGDDKATNDVIPNALLLHLTEREIYLYDIMSQFLVLEIGICFDYFAHINHRGDIVHLSSPTSIVPVLSDNFIILDLVPSGAPPVCPVGQAAAYADRSRQSLYSKKSYRAATESAEHATSSRSYNVASKAFRVKPLVSSDWTPRSRDCPVIDARGPVSSSRSSSTSSTGTAQPSSGSRSSSSTTKNEFDSSSGRGAWPAAPADTSPKPPKPPKQTKASASTDRSNPLHGHAGRDEYNSDRQPRPYREDRERPAAPPGTAFNSMINDNDSGTDAVAAAVDVAKDVTKALGKSLLSFASFSLKAVGEAAAVAQGTYQAHANQAIQVGDMSVTITRELAEGGFGTVYLVQSNGRNYAMKKMLCQTREQVTDGQRELDALIRFSGKSENIISLLAHSSTAPSQGGRKSNILREIYMVFPLYPQGTAWDAVERAVPREFDGVPWPFNERKALHILIGTCRGLLVLHDAGFAHRDVKPHNILLGDDGTPVIMDLGSVTTARQDIKTRQQALNAEEEAASKTSAPYRAPELTSTPNPIMLDERVDVWGVGCTMFCLAFGRSPFETAKEGVLRLAILNGRYQLPAGNRMRQCTFSTAYTDLIQQMLLVDHTQRPFLPEVIATMESMLDA